MFISTYGIGILSHSISILIYLYSLNLLISLKLTPGVQADSCFVESTYCVCSYEFMKYELRSIIETSPPSDLIKKFQSYQCQSYRTIPYTLIATMDEQQQYYTGNSQQGIQEEVNSNKNGYQHEPSPQDNVRGNSPSQNNAANNEPNNDYYPTKDLSESQSEPDEDLMYKFDPRHIHRRKQHPHVPHFATNSRNRDPSNSNTYEEYHSRKRRKKRQFDDSMMENQNMKLQNAIPKLSVESSTPQHTYVFLGHPAQLNCDIDQSKIQSFPNPHFEWIHSNGNPVSAPAASLNSQNGVLTIPSTQLTDIGMYNCSVSSSSAQRTPAMSSSRQLSVVTDSISWLSITTHYLTRTCSVNEMKMLKNNLPFWISDFVCPVCTVHDSSVVCDTISGNQEGLDSNAYQIKFALTAFNLQNEILAGTNSPQLCTELCSQALQLTLLSTVQKSVNKLLALPIQFGRGNMMYAKQDSTFFDLMVGCLAGFQFQYQICFPCLPGHYSLKGESECVECSHGFYQPSPGASKCLPCRDGEDTIESGATHSSACLSSKAVAAFHSAKKHAIIAWILFFLFLILLVILLILLCICCCCPQSKVGICVRKFCCCFCVHFSERKNYSKLKSIDTDSLQSRKEKKVVKHTEMTTSSKRPTKKENIPSKKEDTIPELIPELEGTASATTTNIKIQQKDPEPKVERRKKTTVANEVVHSPPVKNKKTPKSPLKYEQLLSSEVDEESDISTPATSSTELSESDDESDHEPQPRKHSLLQITGEDKFNDKMNDYKHSHPQSKGNGHKRWKSIIEKMEKEARNKQNLMSAVAQFQESTERKPKLVKNENKELRVNKEIIKKSGEQTMTEPLPFSDKEAYCRKPRVKETIAKINAATKYNQIREHAHRRKISAPSGPGAPAKNYVPVYESQRYENEVFSRRRPEHKKMTGTRKTTRSGGHEDVPAATLENEEAQRYGNEIQDRDHHWDHYCHKCIKPSQKQPRYYPPPLPPAPPK